MVYLVFTVLKVSVRVLSWSLDRLRPCSNEGFNEESVPQGNFGIRSTVDTVQQYARKLVIF